MATNNQLNRLKHQIFSYGNYHNYYFHRQPTVPDPRLSLLPPTLFAHKRVLDLGCNAGKLALECATHLSADAVLGVDLDPWLIEEATRLAAIPGGGLERRAVVQFECADFMLPDAASGTAHAWLARRAGEFDTILLLSITKWLHLHHGDDGLVSLFRALYALLPPGGTLVVEPQEWANYKLAVKKNRDLRERFKTLVTRPPFQVELERVGFRLVDSVQREEGGFSRVVMVWRKGEGGEV